jgi:glyoxylase-like metal-dependent hydrolase (beta-lactamase superfamily II)
LNPVSIYAFNPGPITGDGNWTWLIPGQLPTLVDAGTGDPRHLDALETALAGSRLEQVLVTHGHIDDASGAPVIAGRMGRVRFRKMAWPERDAKWSVPWEPIADKEIISAGDTSLETIHTPGHAPDHVCFWHEHTRTLICGDLAVKGSTVWIPASHGGDLAAYLASLDRVLALNPQRMLPAHGPIIEEPEQLLRGYIAHRHEREEQVLDALRQGDQTPEAVTARIYKDLNESFLPLARENVTSQLIKLEREGRAGCEHGRWHIMKP